MASQNNSDKDIIPMGKAIVIIVSILIIPVVLLIAGGIFVLSSLNSSNVATASNTTINNSVNDKSDNEKIIGEWKKLDDQGAYATVSGTDAKWAESYDYGVSALLAGIKSVERYRDTITFKRDGSYIRIVPQLDSKGFMKPDYIFDEGMYELKGINLTLYPNSSKEKTYKIDFDGNTLIFDGYAYKGGGIATSSQSSQNANNKVNEASPSLPTEDEKTLTIDWNTILGEWNFTAYDYTGYQDHATEGTINIKEITERTIVVDIKTDVSTALNKSLRYELDEKKENLTFKHEWTLMEEQGLILDKNFNSIKGTVKYQTVPRQPLSTKKDAQRLQ